MKDPAFLFYTSDFLTGTMLFTDEQVGKYIRALCYEHQHGPMEFEELNAICKDDQIVIKKFKKFGKKYYNERLEEEIATRKIHREKQRENALKRWNKEEKIKDKECGGNAKAMPLEDENVNENINKIKYLDNVYLTNEEYKKLIDKLGEQLTNTYIEKLNNYIGSKGKKYKSHYFTILSWVNKEDKPKTPEWFDKKIEVKPPNEKDKQELESILNDFK